MGDLSVKHLVKTPAESGHFVMRAASITKRASATATHRRSAADGTCHGCFCGRKFSGHNHYTGSEHTDRASYSETRADRENTGCSGRSLLPGRTGNGCARGTPQVVEYEGAINGEHELLFTDYFVGGSSCPGRFLVRGG